MTVKEYGPAKETPMQTTSKYSIEKTKDFLVDCPVKVLQEFERRVENFIQRFLKTEGPYGKVTAWYGRKEYQKRGNIHFSI